MTALKDVHLVIVYENAYSLAASVRCGLFEREMALFRRLRPHLRELTLVSHGVRDRADYSDAVDGINICCNEGNWPGWLFHRWLSAGFARKLSGKVILRSDQLLGAGLTLRMARQVNGWFVARCGYMASDFAARRWGDRSRQMRRMRSIEKKAFPVADLSIVTTPEIKNRICQLYSTAADRIHVIPNYVDMDVMTPSNRRKPSGRRVCFIGRLEKQKNPLSLVEALQGTETELVVVGRGPLRGPMEALAERLQVSVEFLDIFPFLELPDIIRGCDVFVLPSLYEGHPKVLLEAMACGLPVIGADSPGIREVIEHRETGYLCGIGPESIRRAVMEVLGDSDLARHMSNEAHEFAKSTFSLDRVVEMELAALGQLVTPG